MHAADEKREQRDEDSGGTRTGAAIHSVGGCSSGHCHHDMPNETRRDETRRNDAHVQPTSTTSVCPVDQPSPHSSHSRTMAASNFDVSKLFDGKLTLKGADVPVSQLAGKVVAIYFSAHWCPPCRAFTPTLIKAYEAAKAAGLPFELIFVSSDHDEDGFDEYTADMPWPSVKFDVSALEWQGSSGAARVGIGVGSDSCDHATHCNSDAQWHRQSLALAATVAALC